MAYQSNPYLEEWANALRQQQRAAITQSYQDALPGFLSPLFGQDMYLGSNYKDHLAKYASRQAADMANAEQGIISQKAMLEFELWQQQQEQARQMEAERRAREMEGFYADQAKIEGAMGASDSVWDRAKTREDAYFAPGYWWNGQWVTGARPDDYSITIGTRSQLPSYARQSGQDAWGRGTTTNPMSPVREWSYNQGGNVSVPNIRNQPQSPKAKSYRLTPPTTPVRKWGQTSGGEVLRYGGGF